MPKEHTTRSFATSPGPSAPFSPSIVPSVPGGGHPAAAVEKPPVTSTEQPRSPNMSVRLSTERRHPDVPSSPAAGPFAPLATGQPGSDAAPFGAAGVLPDPADLRRAKDLTHGPQWPADDRQPGGPRQPAAGRGRRLRRGEFQRPGRGRRGARAGGVAGAAPRHRSADRRGRRPHLQVAGRRAPDRVHQPGRGDADRARRPGRGRPEAGRRRRRAAANALRHPHGRGDGRRHRPPGRRHQHRVAPAGTCAGRRRAGVGRGHGPDQRPPLPADRGPGCAPAAQHQPPGAGLCGGAGAAAGDGAGARQLPAAAALDRRAAVRRFVRRDGGPAGQKRGGRSGELVAERGPGRGHHRGALLPARAGRDLARLGAALSRLGARSGHDPPRARRALHADGQRAAGRPPGAAVGRAVRLRKRPGDLGRPLLGRGRGSFCVAGRALSAGWWRRSRPRCTNRS